MSVYPDASFLFAVYRAQGNSAVAIALFQDMPGSLPATELVLYEFRQAVRLQVFLHTKDWRKGFPAVEAHRVLTNFEADLSAGVLERFEVDFRAVFARAEMISARYTQADGNRAFDILHVATAKELGAGEFLSFDGNQRRLAAAEGLTALPVVL